MSDASSEPRRLPMAGGSTAVADDGLRTSNGVDGFKYSRLKGMLYVLKIFGSLPLLPLWPLMMAYEARDSSIAKNYFSTMAYVLRTLVVHVRFGSWWRMVKYNFLLGSKAVKARIESRRGGCTRCAKCCKQYECIFLGQNAETNDSYCKVYQKDYWYYGTCGRYPLDQQDIDDHACPGFSFSDSPE